MLEIVAVAAAVLALIAVIMMINAVVLHLNAIASRMKKSKIEEKGRKETMSQAKEGVTFNDIFMFMIAVPLVLLWVGFAGYVIWHGLRDPGVLAQIEGYTTLIAILGGPALLIIKDALDVWKQEQAEKTAFYKIKAQAVIDYNDKAQEQAQMIETKQQEQEHKMENKK
tara:strand:+ start:609 stop:1112 length:504 start_codon:yes stop_codon:yes gene_type:complete